MSTSEIYSLPAFEIFGDELRIYALKARVINKFSLYIYDKEIHGSWSYQRVLVEYTRYFKKISDYIFLNVLKAFKVEYLRKWEKDGYRLFALLAYETFDLLILLYEFNQY